MAKKATRLIRDAVAARYFGHPARAYDLLRQAETWATKHYQPRLAGQARRLQEAWGKRDSEQAERTVGVIRKWTRDEFDAQGRRVIYPD